MFLWRIEFEEIFKWSEGVSYFKVNEKESLGINNGKYRGYEILLILRYLSYSKKVIVVE